MSVSAQLTRALKQALGEEPSEELLAMFESNRSQFGEVRSDISALKADVAELRHEMRVGFERARADMSDVKAELMKWSFVYWVGAVTAIAVLFRTLR